MTYESSAIAVPSPMARLEVFGMVYFDWQLTGRPQLVVRTVTGDSIKIKGNMWQKHIGTGGWVD